MELPLMAFLLAVGTATVGIFLGWWLRGRRQQFATDSSEDKSRVQDALALLHDLTARVAADVGHHNTRVKEINEELTSLGDSEAVAVVDVVAKLVEANQQMQEQLATAEVRLIEQERQTESLAVEARTDPLTQLANRRAFDDEISRRVGEFERYRRDVSAMMFDVDHFKKFNDTYGHQAGDEVLRGVARVLKQSMREIDLAARYGGEEFSVVLPDTSVQEAVVSAERARQAIEAARFEFDGAELRVTTSVGVAQLRSTEDGDAMIQRADEALYAAKGAGRNRVSWHDGRTCHAIEDAAASDGSHSSDDAASSSDSPVRETASKETSARTDRLTGLSNRVVFREDVNRRMAEYQRSGSPLSVVLVEIDDYAKILARYGESAGDMVLRVAAQFLQATMRDMDHVARYDSETFSLLLPGARLTDAAQVAERLRHAVSRCTLPLGDGHFQFTVSAGVAETLQGDDSEHLLRRTAEALDAAGMQTRDSVFVHDGRKCRPIAAELVAAE